MKRKHVKGRAALIFGVIGMIATVASVATAIKDSFEAKRRIDAAKEADPYISEKEQIEIALPCYKDTAKMCAVALGSQITSLSMSQKEIRKLAAVAVTTLEPAKKNIKKATRNKDKHLFFDDRHNRYFSADFEELENWWNKEVANGTYPGDLHFMDLFTPMGDGMECCPIF